MTLTAAQLRDEVRRALRQVTLDGEDAGASVSAQDLSDSAFGDDDIDAELLAAARHLAMVCRADALDQLLSTRHPDDLFDSPKPLRVLGGRVRFQGLAASRMGRMALMARSSRYTVGDVDDPIYVAQDGRVDVYAGGRNPLGADVVVITLPQSPTDLPDKLAPALIHLSVTECWAQLDMGARVVTSMAEYVSAVGSYLRMEDPLVRTIQAE